MKKGYLDALSSKKIIKDQGLLRHEDIRHQLTIIPELQALIPPLLPDELTQLETNIRQDGCREALLVWETTKGVVQQTEDAAPAYVLIDGHNRYSICRRHGLDFRMNLRSFATMDDVRTFMIDNQLGRRNLSPEQTAYLRGLRYRDEKKTRGQYDRREQMGQNVPFASEDENGAPAAAQSGEKSTQSTAQRLAKQYNVNEKTIKRDAEFSAGVDKLAPDLKAQFLAGKLNINKSAIQQLGKINQPDGSVSTLDELVAGLPSSIPPASTATITTTGRAGASNKKAKPAILRSKLKALLSQIAEPSDKDIQLLDEIAACVSQLKAALTKNL